MKRDYKAFLIHPTTMERLMKSIGAERVSMEASKELANLLEEKGKQIATKALQYARHAHRKTILASDVRLSSSSNV